MADEFALVLPSRSSPQNSAHPEAAIIDVPMDLDSSKTSRSLKPDIEAMRKRTEGKSLAVLDAYYRGHNSGTHAPGSVAEAKEAARAFYQGRRDVETGRPHRYLTEWAITFDGIEKTGEDEPDGPKVASLNMGTRQEGNLGATVALIAVGGAALLGLAAAAFSARSSGKKTAAKVPQPPASPPVPTGFVPPAVPPATQPPQSTPPARTSTAEPPREYTPTPTNRPLSSPPIVFNPTALFDFGADDFNQNRNTGIVPPDDTGVAVTRLITFGPGEYDSATGILNRTNRTLSSGELQRLEAAGLNVPPPSGSGSTGYLQPGDALVPDLTPEQYSTMWLESYNAGYKYGARLKKADAANKVVSLAHIDGQRAGFLGLAASPPAAEPGRTEYLQGYELGKVTDKEAGGAALVKAEASAWGSWDAVRGVPARSGPPAHHVSAANA